MSIDSGFRKLCVTFRIWKANTNVNRNEVTRSKSARIKDDLFADVYMALGKIKIGVCQ